MLDTEIIEQVQKYHWYHTIQLTDTIKTPGWEPILPIISLILRNMTRLDFSRKRILDLGCRDGLMSFEAEKQGAAEIIAIDNDLSPGAVEFLIPFFRSKINMVEMNLFDLRPEKFGLFDVVLFPGLLYHLRYPFWALKLVRDILSPGAFLLLETAVRVENEDDAILYCPIGKDSPYEPTSCTFFNKKGMNDTLTSLGLEVISVDSLVGIKPDITPTENIQPRGKDKIDRVVFICRYNPAILDKEAVKYWDSNHNIHSSYYYPWGDTE